MAKKSKNMVKLGIFVSIGILLFTWSMYYLGNSKNMFGNTFSISSFFQNVNGLQPGNNVRYSGINVGSVRHIEIVNDSTLEVVMTIQNRAKGFIKKNAIASIGMDGLVGSTLINITPSKGKSFPLEENDIIKSYSKLETNEMLQTLGTTNENIAMLSLNLLQITEKINQGDGTLGILLSDNNMADDLRKSIFYIKNTGNELAKMSYELNGMIRNTKDGNGLLGYLLTDTSLTMKVENVVDQVNGKIDNQVDPIFDELKNSADELTKLMNTLNSLANDVEDGKGTLGTLLKNQSTDDEIQNILHNVNESTAKLNENMEALKHNWFFRRYFKKQEKAARKAAKKNEQKDKLSGIVTKND